MKIHADASAATVTILSPGDLLRQAGELLHWAARAVDRGDEEQTRLCLHAAWGCVQTAFGKLARQRAP